MAVGDGSGRVVDFRARPNTADWARYMAARRAKVSAEERARTRGTSPGTYELPEETLAGFIAKLDDAGIERAVFASRDRSLPDPNWPVTNDYVAECVAAYPDRLVGFAGVDVTDPGTAEAEAARAVRELGLRGVCFDPPALLAAPDDRRLDGLYGVCQELGVPVFVTLGGWQGVPLPVSYANPLALDTVAKRFPDLVIIGSHAGWPFVTEMIAVAWRCENVYFENSFHCSAPGADLLVQAAGGMLAGKMLYASGYPFVPLAETLEQFRRLPFDPESLQHVLYDNAMALLTRIGAIQETTSA